MQKSSTLGFQASASVGLPVKFPGRALPCPLYTLLADSMPLYVITEPCQLIL